MTSKINSELDLYSGHQVDRAQKTETAPKKASDKLVEDIWISILEYLPAKDLARCTSINQSLSNVAQLPNLWKNLVLLDKYSLVADLEPFVKNNQLTWKEVYRYKQLSPMITKMIEREDDPFLNQFIRDNNQEYQHVPSQSLTIKRPLTRLGDQIFSICDSYNVKITKPGQAEPIILQGRPIPGLRLLELYVDQGNLYVLRENGTIAKWDLEKRVQTATIRSFFSENIRTLGPNEDIPTVKQFLVQDGYVVLAYQKNTEPHLEIIDANHPVETQLIRDKVLPVANQMLIHEGKLYILGELGTVGESLVYIWDLSKSKCLGVIKIPTNSDLGLSSMTIENHLLCVSEMYGISNFHGPKIHLINTKTGKAVQTFNLNYRVNYLKKTVMIENLLIAYAEIKNASFNPEIHDSYIPEKAMLVIDLNIGEVIAWTQEIFDQDSDQLHAELPAFLVEETQNGVKNLHQERRTPDDEEHKSPDVPLEPQKASKKNRCVIQ